MNVDRASEVKSASQKLRDRREIGCGRNTASRWSSYEKSQCSSLRVGQLSRISVKVSECISPARNIWRLEKDLPFSSIQV